LRSPRGYPWDVDAESTVAARTRYRARPGRRVIVVTDLASLRGPVHGTVEFQLRRYWSSTDRTFDLDKPYMRRWYHQGAGREASRPEDLTHHLHRDTLIGLWPDLYLPREVRQAWEEHHPVLRSNVAAASA
jgi:hypothetical protein